MTDSDHDLVVRTRNGDRVAFDRLIERHGADVLHHLLRLTRRREDALDLFQDTFLAAFRSIGSLREPGAFRAWTATIGRNLFRKRGRRISNMAETETLDDVAANETDGDNTAAHGERDSALRSAIAALPERQRSVLSARLDLGLPFQQIGTLIGISEENARACHYQALKALRRKVPQFAARFGGAP
jgi:RNA polymerase sigma-70 factor, ECF subfamily